MAGREQYLLDTHVVLWALTEPARLSPRAAGVLRRRDNRLFVSSASVWEIATKHRLGKLPGADALVGALAAHLARFRAEELPIRHVHALVAGSLPAEHRDPFDRMLAAQASVDGLTLVSADPAFHVLGVHPVW